MSAAATSNESHSHTNTRRAPSLGSCPGQSAAPLHSSFCTEMVDWSSGTSTATRVHFCVTNSSGSLRVPLWSVYSWWGCCSLLVSTALTRVVWGNHLSISVDHGALPWLRWPTCHSEDSRSRSVPAGQEEMVPSWETSLSCSRDEHGSMLILEPIQSLSGWRTRVGSKSHSETHLRPSWRDAQTWLWWSSLLYLPQLCRVCFQAVWRQGPTLLQRQHSEVRALCNSYCQIWLRLFNCSSSWRWCRMSLSWTVHAAYKMASQGTHDLSRTTDKLLCFSFRWRSTSHLNSSEFWEEMGTQLGFAYTASGPLVRSSWQSWRVFH